MFLTVPQAYDPQTFQLLNRMSLYIKALESKLLQQGILGFGEVEREASRNEALQAIEHLNEHIKATNAAIDSIMDPIAQREARVKWECSQDKAAVEAALQTYQQQLAETFKD